MRNLKNWEDFNEKLEDGYTDKQDKEFDKINDLAQNILDVCDDDYVREELILKSERELEEILTNYHLNKNNETCGVCGGDATICDGC